MHYSLALGFFDGVHLAHRQVLDAARRAAAARGVRAAAITFDRHPASALAGCPQTLLQTLPQRVETLRGEGGMDEVFVLPFDAALRDMPWRDFVEELLIGRYAAVHVAVGYDFRFGRGGEGDAAALAGLLAAHGLGCSVVPQVELDGAAVSATRIRTAVQEGRVEEAARLLGRPFAVSGTVQPGKRLGRTLGFPTMNVPVPPEVVVPTAGVYISRVVLDGVSHPAVTNVDSRALTESYVFSFSADTYGRSIRVEFIRHLRPMRRFDSLDALRAQIAADRDEAEAYFRREPCL